jgi:hypothetical protein
MAEIVVTGTELRIYGEHTIQSLAVRRNAANVAGVVTHTAGVTFLDRSGVARQGMLLTITGDLSVQGVAPPNLVASRIDVSGKGSARSTGMGAGAGSADNAHGGGAGHGGAGGNSASGREGGGCVGSVTQPTAFGSGGGSTRFNSAGSAGGGAVHVTVGGVATLDGDVWCDGQAGTVPNYADGGGAGGSLWIWANQILGAGKIHANGGNGGNGNAGGGGGGRIAMYSCTQLPESRVTVNGGTGLEAGQRGSIVRGANIRLDQPVTTPRTVLVPHDAVLSIVASSTRPPFTVNYAWQRFNRASGLFENLAEGQDARFFGVASSTLRVFGRLSSCGDELFKCILSDTCGAMPSPTILVQFRSPADLDDGSGTRTPDNAVTIDDLLFFLPLYLQGDPGVDLDDGTGNGDPDGGVTIDDLLFFLDHLYAGC